MKGQKTTVAVHGDEGLKNLEKVIGADHDISMSELIAVTGGRPQEGMTGENMANKVDIKVGGQAKFNVTGLANFMAPGAKAVVESGHGKQNIMDNTLTKGAGLQHRVNEANSQFQAAFPARLQALVADPTISKDDKIRFMHLALERDFSPETETGIATSAKTNTMSADAVASNQTFIQGGRAELEANILALGGDPNGSSRVPEPAVNR
ncbi:MAG: hypothetical protein H7338_21755 [Candidatus Sericytochromatia bacterium]|nr:hypothetical protein [Candidatus Sericytochromatia bacterium]